MVSLPAPTILELPMHVELSPTPTCIVHHESGKYTPPQGMFVPWRKKAVTCRMGLGAAH